MKVSISEYMVQVSCGISFTLWIPDQRSNWEKYIYPKYIYPCDISKRINTADDELGDSEEKIYETHSLISQKEPVNDELHTSKKEIKTKWLEQYQSKKPKLKQKVRYLPVGKDKWKNAEILSKTHKHKLNFKGPPQNPKTHQWQKLIQ